MPQSGLSLHHVAQPPRVPGSEPHPLLLLLHGYGANELDLLPLADELDGRYFVVSVRAPLSAGPGYAWYPLAQSAAGDLIPDLATLRISLETLRQFVGALLQTYPIDAKRGFTLGFSQGAVMAGGLLLTAPNIPRGTVMLSGYLPLDAVTPAAPDDLRGKAVFVGHGRFDQVIPIAAGRASRDYLEKVGADLTYHEYPIAHFIGPEELADVEAWLG